MNFFKAGMKCLFVGVYFPASGAMSMTPTLAATQDSPNMGHPITGLVRPAGVSEVIFSPPSFTSRSYPK